MNRLDPKSRRVWFGCSTLKIILFELRDKSIEERRETIFDGIEKCGFGITNLGVQMLSIPIWDHLVIPNLPDPLECVSYTKYF